MDLPELSSLERAVLTAPDVIARVAARTVAGPSSAGCCASRATCACSFVEDVLDGARDQTAAERWILLQDDAVRRSYVADVLDRP